MTHTENCTTNSEIAITRDPMVKNLQQNCRVIALYVMLALSGKDILSALWYAARAHDRELRDVTQDATWAITGNKAKKKP